MTVTANKKKLIKSVKFWDRLSKNYDKKAMDKTFDMICSKTPTYLEKNDTVLDFACATGLYTVEFAKYVSEIKAFDTSNKMVALAEIKARKNQVNNASFSCATLFDESYKKGSFDVILVFNILLYFENIEEVLSRLFYLLKPGGLIISSTACLKEKRSFLSIVTTPILFLLVKLGILPYLKFYKLKELERKIATSGFQTIETEILFDSPATEYFIVSKKISPLS